MMKWKTPPPKLCSHRDFHKYQLLLRTTIVLQVPSFLTCNNSDVSFPATLFGFLRSKPSTPFKIPPWTRSLMLLQGFKGFAMFQDSCACQF
ncbi:hypothetical protein S83_009659 [Arachis hypogaea]